jgi:hypothetical protein
VPVSRLLASSLRKKNPSFLLAWARVDMSRLFDTFADSRYPMDNSLNQSGNPYLASNTFHHLDDTFHLYKGAH